MHSMGAGLTIAMLLLGGQAVGADPTGAIARDCELETTFLLDEARMLGRAVPP